MRTRLAASILISGLVGLGATASSQTIRTPAEQADYARYTQHQEVAPFLATVAGATKQAKVAVVGKTGQGKDFASVDLLLAVVTDEGIDSPKALNRKKPTVLVLAAQHGNEQSGNGV